MPVMNACFMLRSLFRRGPCALAVAATPPRRSRTLVSDSPEVGLEHHGDELLERGPGLPSKLGLHPGGVAAEGGHLGRTNELGIDLDVVPPFESRVRERDLAELLDGGGATGRDDVFLGLLGLKHQPHRPDIVTREAPVPLGLQVAHAEILGLAMLDPGDAVGYLAGY